MKIFEFDNYKAFIRAKVKAMPRKGHGQMSRIAELLGVHTTMVTHIVKGDSNLSTENGLTLAGYFGLNELETEYFVTLIQRQRAANNQSRDFFTKQLARLKDRALNLSETIKIKTVLGEEDQAIFYSAWYYSAIRLLTALKGFQDRDSIAQNLNVPIRTVNKVVDFLISRSLCQESDDKLIVGESTFVGRDSTFIARHHSNWRMRVMEQFTSIGNEELVFTNPITVSHRDFGKIRDELVGIIETFRKIADPSPPELLCCLNIDWMKIRAR